MTLTAKLNSPICFDFNGDWMDLTQDQANMLREAKLIYILGLHDYRTEDLRACRKYLYEHGERRPLIVDRRANIVAAIIGAAIFILLALGVYFGG